MTDVYPLYIPLLVCAIFLWVPGLVFLAAAFYQWGRYVDLVGTEATAHLISVCLKAMSSKSWGEVDQIRGRPGLGTGDLLDKLLVRNAARIKLEDLRLLAALPGQSDEKLAAIRRRARKELTRRERFTPFATSSSSSYTVAHQSPKYHRLSIILGSLLFLASMTFLWLGPYVDPQGNGRWFGLDSYLLTNPSSLTEPYRTLNDIIPTAFPWLQTLVVSAGIVLGGLGYWRMRCVEKSVSDSFGLLLTFEAFAALILLFESLFNGNYDIYPWALYLYIGVWWFGCLAEVNFCFSLYELADWGVSPSFQLSMSNLASEEH